MRIALDVTSAINGATGIARYVTALADEWGAHDQVEVAAFAVGRGGYPVPSGARHLRLPLRWVGRSWRLHGPPRVERLVGPVDSIHACGSFVPTGRAPIVAVVYDLAGLAHPDLHPARDVAQLRGFLADLGRAAAVVAISQATADDLVRRGVRPEVVHPIPLGVSDLPPARPTGWARPYVLAVGAPVPRKAYVDLLRAVARIGDPELTVVIVGPPGSEDEALEALAVELRLGDRYHRAGRVDEAELAGWYQGAAAVAAPSVDEGFGFPVLEAQRAGAPVVASDIESHREIAGGAAMLVPVGDVDRLAEALEAAIAGGTSVAAAVLAGADNARRYTWAACAEATLAVHRAVAG
jgi:glycosyltransferase involved in cell wall biosynthesis